MPRKKLTAAEAIEQFTSRLEQIETRPTINRWTPMPQQEVFLQSQAKHRIAFGGNRAGKTAVTTADDAMVITRRHPHRQHMYADNRPLKMRIIGSDFERGVDQTLVPYIQQYIPPSFLINGSWEDSYRRAEHFLTLADKSTISFMSYEQDPDKFQSVSLDHVHYDEEPPQAIWREGRLRLLDTNGTSTISETPVQQLEWVQDEIIEPWQAGLLPDYDIITLRTLDNIHLSAEAVAELVADMDEDEKLIRLEGQYPPGKSKVFPEFTGKFPFVIPHQLFLDRFHEDPGPWSFYESMDYGYVNPTAWIWTAVHTDGSIVTMHVRYAARVDVEAWAQIVKLTRRNLAGQLDLSQDDFMRKLRGTFGDPSIGKGANGVTGTTIQQEYALRGVYIGTDGIYEARAGNNNFGLNQMHKYLKLRPAAAGIPASTGMLGAQPWWQITDAGADFDYAQNDALIDEMRRARTPKQTLKQQDVKNPAEQIRDKDNHAIDATKYLYMVTHELRPWQFVERPDESFREVWTERFGPGSAPSLETAPAYDDFDGRVAAQWDTYSSLED
jgi:phage terminase large subunit-like protein